MASSLKPLFNCKILSIFAKFSLTFPLSVHLPYTCRFLTPPLRPPSLTSLATSVSLQSSDLITDLFVANSLSELFCACFLSCQQTLLLHGNLISSLAVIKEHLPSAVCTLSLADNEISDLNEVHMRVF